MKPYMGSLLIADLRASPYLYSAALLIFYAPHQPPLNLLNL